MNIRRRFQTTHRDGASRFSRNTLLIRTILRRRGENQGLESVHIAIHFGEPFEIIENIRNRRRAHEYDFRH